MQQPCMLLLILLKTLAFKWCIYCCKIGSAVCEAPIAMPESKTEPVLSTTVSSGTSAQHAFGPDLLS